MKRLIVLCTAIAMAVSIMTTASAQGKMGGGKMHGGKMAGGKMAGGKMGGQKMGGGKKAGGHKMSGHKMAGHKMGKGGKHHMRGHMGKRNRAAMAMVRRGRMM